MSDEEEQRDWEHTVAVFQFSMAALSIVLITGFVLGKVAAWW